MFLAKDKNMQMQIQRIQNITNNHKYYEIEKQIFKTIQLYFRLQVAIWEQNFGIVRIRDDN